ncbi:AP2 domain-containing protein [Citricoccus sp. NR2]|uniref:AP2 domain-containing protein n=1 Tax=Citricoccus sp. NR2 TaxID=3004095 RepID=UPI0022DE40AC|nr:AP2 domain-containing protein [Citricoccus sp. NR2]WBL18505.1 AP2 domain-containing protein [Citricoccus sp. NR2]
MQHLRPERKNSTTGLRGVTRHKLTGKFAAAVRHQGETHHLGLFVTAEEAGEAARAKRLELFTHNDLDRALEQQAPA